MNNTRKILIATLVLAAIALIFWVTNRKATIKEELRDFAISDTASIGRIFMVDRRGISVSLERKNESHWTVNGQYKARTDAMNILLMTMIRMDVQVPVANAARDNVIRNLSTKGVKVEVYSKDNPKKPFKTFYVGGPTQSQLGTFMMLENSSAPFVMHIPGFNGYLTPRFFTAITEWRSREIFNYAETDIKKITLENLQDPQQSFQIQFTGSGAEIRSNGQVIPESDPSRLMSYAGFYRNIQFEVVDTMITKPIVDSIVGVGPVRILSVETHQGEKRKVKIYLKPVSSRTIMQEDQEGHALPYDLDRMYATLDDDTQFVIIQNYVFDKLLRKASDFMAQKTGTGI